MNVSLILLLAYSALQVGLGLWIGRRVRGAGDFFVAGRGLGPGLLFATFVAANIGAGSTVGAAGLGYRDGLSGWWWVGSAGLGSLLLAFSVGPRIRRVAAAGDFRTVGDFLEARYNRTVRGVIAALLWIGTLAILAGQLIALAWVLNVVAGLPKVFGCLLGGVVVIAYFSAGGLLTSAYVNFVQVIVKFLGFAVAWPLALAAAGGWAAVGDATASVPDYWNFFEGGSSGWIYVVQLAPAFLVSPGLLQKIYGARDDRAVRWGVASNAAVLLAFAIVPVSFGMIARTLHPALDNPELALPTLLTENLPPLVGSLGLAALFSAEVSSADAILFMLSTSLSQDLYGRFVNPAADDRTLLRVARATSLVAGAIGVALAVVSPSVIGALSVFYSLLGVSLFVPIVAGLYVPRAGAVEALSSMTAGVAALLAARTGMLAMHPAVAGMSAAVAAFVVVFAVRTAIRGTADR